MIVGALIMCWWTGEVTWRLFTSHAISWSFCSLLIRVGTCGYIAFKALLYITFLLRVYESYKGGILAYSTRLLYGFGIYFVLWSIINMFATFTLKGSTISGNCTYDASWFFVASVQSLECTATFATTYLFAKPLFKLNTFIPEIKLLIVRQVILNAISVMTTINVMTFVGIQNIFFIESSMTVEGVASIDVLISTVCVILMDPKHEKIASRLLASCCCGYYRKLSVKTSNSNDEHVQDATESTTTFATSNDTTTTQNALTSWQRPDAESTKHTQTAMTMAKIVEEHIEDGRDKNNDNDNSIFVKTKQRTPIDSI